MTDQPTQDAIVSQRDREDPWSDANTLRSIAKDVARWPCNATCDGAPSSADTLRDIADRLDRFEAAVRADQMERDAGVATQIASATNEDGVQIYKDHVCMGAEMAAAAILSQKEPQG